MAVANTNRIMTHGDGEAIAKSLQNVAEAVGTQSENVRLTGDQTIAGSKSFSNPVKTNEIDSLDGNAVVRNTDSAIVLGSSTKKAVLMGNGTRPTYSKSGSDLTGSELALKSDFEEITKLTDINIRTPERGTWNFLNSASNVYYTKSYLNIDITLCFSNLTYGDYNQFNEIISIVLSSGTFTNTVLGNLINLNGVKIKDSPSTNTRVGMTLMETTQADSYDVPTFQAFINARNFYENSIDITLIRNSTSSPSFVSGKNYVGTLHVRLPLSQE